MLAKTTYHWKAPTSDFTSESWAERIKAKENFGSWRKKNNKRNKTRQREKRVEATGTVGLIKKLGSC